MPADQTVMDAFNFTDQDLAANREGRLSTAQRSRLWRDISLAGLFVFGPFSVILLIIGVGAGAGLSSIGWLLAFTVGIMLALAGVFYAASTQQLYAVQGDLNLTMSIPTDTPYSSTAARQSSSSHILEIEQQNFRISDTGYAALKSYAGEFGVVYFLALKKSQLLLSIDIGRMADLNQVRLWGKDHSPDRKRKKARSR